jgi:hypothetical protein
MLVTRFSRRKVQSALSVARKFGRNLNFVISWKRGLYLHPYSSPWLVHFSQCKGPRATVSRFLLVICDTDRANENPNQSCCTVLSYVVANSFCISSNVSPLVSG